MRVEIMKYNGNKDMWILKRGWRHCRWAASIARARIPRRCAADRGRPLALGEDVRHRVFERQRCEMVQSSSAPPRGVATICMQQDAVPLSVDFMEARGYMFSSPRVSTVGSDAA